MTSGQNISHYRTAKLSVHVWNHDLIWWQNKIDTQKHFHQTTITISWTLSKTKIPITIVKAQMPSNPNQKSRKRDTQEHALNRLRAELEELRFRTRVGKATPPPSTHNSLYIRPAWQQLAVNDMHKWATEQIWWRYNLGTFPHY